MVMITFGGTVNAVLNGVEIDFWIGFVIKTGHAPVAKK